MSKVSYRKDVLKLSKGVASTLGEITLAVIDVWLSLSSTPHARNAHGAWRAFYGDQGGGDDIFDWISENEEAFNKAFYHLKRRGLVNIVKDGVYYRPQITKFGKDRLKEVIPTYKEKRLWDKKLYLVTYDIGEEKKMDRDLLRACIKKMGCGMLQLSVWITPYNPKEVLRKFIKDRKLRGSVLISDVASDGSIGDETIPELVERVFGLKKLNDRYLDFLGKFSGGGEYSRINLHFEFVTILKDDPQLPFELLPAYWVGDSAYECYRKLLHS